VLWLRRCERILVQNRRLRSNAVCLIQNFRYKGSPHQTFFAQLVRPMNALQLRRWQFSHKETLQQTFFKRSAILERNRPSCVCEIPFGGLWGNVRRSSWSHRKRVVDFLLVLIKLFTLGVTAEELRANIG